ncbi:MAG: hypothetical protein JWP50_941 [Phenylobacterium sp.]|nr:hypothetical protein [Phenylobacterium sp.]
MSEGEAGSADDSEGREGGRIIVEITDWDWHMFVGMPPPTMPKSALFQGWLTYTNSLEVQGRIVSPSVYHWKTVSFWISPLPEKVRLTKADRALPAFQRVGHFGETTSPDRRTDFSGSAHAPAEALPTAMTAFGSVWKILQLSVAGDPRDGAAIEWFSFSRAIPPKLVRDDWSEG